MKILIIEDELTLGKALKANLEAEAYAVDIEADGERGLYRAKTNDYDAILLDDILPGKRGYEICRQLRKNGATVPILMMSVQSELDTRIGLLNDGADDYLAKPFSYQEMSARLRALLRRSKNLSYGEVRVDDLLLDETNATVIRAGQHIYLTTKEFGILRYLAKNAGHLVSRAMLLEHVWDSSTDPFSNMVETHMHNLRRKIDQPGWKKLIYTIPGRGYQIKV